MQKKDLQVDSKCRLDSICPSKMASKRHLDSICPFKLASKRHLNSIFALKLASKRYLESTWPFKLTSKRHLDSILRFKLAFKRNLDSILALHVLFFSYCYPRLRYLFRIRRDLRKTYENHRFLKVFCISTFARTLLKSSRKPCKNAALALKFKVMAFLLYKCSWTAVLQLLCPTWVPPGLYLEPLGRLLGLT